MTAGIKANVDGSAAIQVGGVDAITLTSAGAASFVTSPMTIQGGSAAAPSLTFSGDTNTGIFSPAADTIAFSEGGVESMRIDANANVGLSVTPTNNTLGKTIQIGQSAVFTSDTTANRFWIGSNWYFNSGDKYIVNGFATLYGQQNGEHRWWTAASGTANNNITFTQAMTLSAAGGLSVGTTTDAGAGNIRVNGGALIGDGTAAAPTFTFYNQSDVGMFRAGSGVLGFSTGGTERARIDSSGNLLLGTTSQVGRFTMRQSSEDFPGGLIYVASGGGVRWGMVVGGDNKFYLGYSASSTLAPVGNFATNGVYTATSDVRKKKDISYEFEGLSLVQALKPAMGRMLDDEDSFPLRPLFIAQDVQTVLPSLVSSIDPDPTTLDPFLGVDYASIAPVLVKALQELKAELDATKAEVALLKGAA